MWLGDLDNANGLGAENLSPLVPLMPLDVSCFSCGEGIAENHHFWSLNTSGFVWLFVCFLLQGSSWINVWSSACLNLRFWGFFWLNWHSLMSCPIWNAHLCIFNMQGVIPEVHSGIQESSAALQPVQERQDPAISSSQQAAVSLQEKALWALKGKTAKDDSV